MDRLTRHIEEWLKRQGTTGKWLFTKAGLSAAGYTNLRQGKNLWPQNIKKLAEVMEVSPARLLIDAGYMNEEDLRVEDINADVEEIVNLWRALPPERKDDLLAQARLWLHREDQKRSREDVEGKGSWESRLESPASGK